MLVWQALLMLIVKSHSVWYNIHCTYPPSGRMFNRMATPVKFLRETYSELRQVVWPTRGEVLRLTVIVITISVVVGAYIGILDVAFARGMEALLR